MTDIIKIKKGLSINLKGAAEKIFVKTDKAEFFAVKPTDFHGLIPKLEVQEGDSVLAGSALFHDKNHPEIKFVSPVSGKISAINRGDRRQIMEIVIKTEGTEYKKFLKADPTSLDSDVVKNNLLESGLWPLILQRPYDIIANPAILPKSIFISAFDTAPLAPDYDFLIKGMEHEFQYGINALLKLTSGKIHLNINNDYSTTSSFLKIQGVQVNIFSGKHPAGNVGVQINKIDPVNKGEVVWCLRPQDIISIGRLFLNGQYDASKIVVVAGSGVKYPRYCKTISGTSLVPIIEGNIKEGGDTRIISGNIFTGKKVTNLGFLGFYDSMVTIIPEGNYSEFLGWALPGLNKFSFSRSFFSWMTPNKSYSLDTNLHGGHRSFVITGQYEKVFPMDILPVQLLKAILANDIDKMEQLGIYEVAPEDFALCEFVCTSKIDAQEIIRNGLDTMMKEMN